MNPLFDSRRYLTDFDAVRAGHHFTDILVVGAGVAGARAAIEAASHGAVTLLCKGELHDSATNHAQGGIAVALDGTDARQCHYDDTIRVGCRLNDPRAVRILVDEGPERIAELIDWGMTFDRAGDTLALGREGGHSVHRVVHALGDQTGRELVRTLERKLRQSPRIRVFEHCFLIDFLTVDGRCVGAVTHHHRHGHQLLWAKQTILAAGGCAAIWRETTNPAGSTGDGLAAAFRARATCRNLEFMQFHPTTLYVAGAGRALISEAVRGEGAYLVDRSGERFMQAYHPDAELAPRDVVSRAIQSHMEKSRSPCVYLDVRHHRNFADRFPFIAAHCAEFRIDVTRDLIPVRPSAHYLVGGISADVNGATDVPGLLVCGEAAYNGVHGANRMASNSLLEGLVFGRRAGEYAGIAAASAEPVAVRNLISRNTPSARTALDISDIRNSLGSLMGRNLGIVRRGERLAETGDILDFWAHYTLDKTFDDPAGWELQNRLTVARLIALSALARGESLGVHYREDRPLASDKLYHVDLQPGDEGTEVRKTHSRNQTRVANGVRD